MLSVFLFFLSFRFSVFFFFFQAEDGIRDLYVTGVQTCALPILHVHDGDLQLGAGHPRGSRRDDHHGDQESDPSPRLCLTSHPPLVHGPPLSSKSQYWNGPPNENSSKHFCSCGFVLNGFPSPTRTGPTGDN